MQTTWLVLKTCLSSGVCSFGMCSCVRAQPPGKCLGSESLMSFPGGHFTQGGTSAILCDSGEDAGRLLLVSSVLARAPLPSAAGLAPFHLNKSQL